MNPYRLIEQSRSHRTIVFLIGLGLLALIALADLYVHHAISFAPFYILPVLAVGFLIGRMSGVYMAVLSAVGWLIIDIYTEPAFSGYGVHFWNTVARILFFSFVAFGVRSLAIAQMRQRELAGFIVHDLKAPLANILFGMETIKTRGYAPPETVEKTARITTISAKRMLGLVESIVDLIKIEENTYQRLREGVSPAVIVEQSVELVSAWAERRKVRLDIRQDSQRTQIITDPQLVIRIIVNLLSNALKASPEGSTITVRIADAEKGWLHLSVADQGPGMEATKQQPLYSRIFNLDDTPAGSGLGLTFCRRAAEALGGHLVIENRPEKGMLIVVQLPTE